MTYENEFGGEVTVDFSYKHSKWGTDRLTKAFFCDGKDEFELGGDKEIKKTETGFDYLDVSIHTRGNRVVLSRPMSRKLWDFLQMNGFRIWR